MGAYQNADGAHVPHHTRTAQKTGWCGIPTGTVITVFKQVLNIAAFSRNTSTDILFLVSLASSGLRKPLHYGPGGNLEASARRNRARHLTGELHYLVPGNSHRRHRRRHHNGIGAERICKELASR